MKGWIRLAFSREVVRRALAMACIVGPILIAINHSEAVLGGTMDAGRWVRSLLTLLVPYVVSTVSSVQSLRSGR